MPNMLTYELAFNWMFKPVNEKAISELAQWQVPYQELHYYTLDKSFLNPTDPLKPKYHPELPPLDVPGGDKNSAMSADTGETGGK